MLTKKQFQGKYEQAVILIKQFKLNNDKNNKNLGVYSYSQILNQIDSQESYIKNLIKKIQDIEEKLAENYLDPQTARKIGTIKQQLRMQSQRRNYICSTVRQQAQKQSQNKKSSTKYDYIQAKINKKNKNSTHSSQVQLTSQFTSYNNPYESINSNNFYSRQNDYHNKISQNNENTTSYHNSNSQITQQVEQFDFQFENRLIKQKNEQLNNVKQKMLNIHNIAIQTSQLVNQQGQNLDLIGGQLAKTHKNAKQAKQQLYKAQQYQKRSRSKYLLCAIFIIIAAVILIVLFYLSY